MIKEKTKSFLHPSDGIMAESDKEKELDATKAKMERVKEENLKLKLLLSTVLNDYNSLQMQVSKFIRHEVSVEHDDFGVDISLRLGRSEVKICETEEQIEKMRFDKISDENKEGSEKKTNALPLGFRIRSCDHPNPESAANKCLSSKKDVKTARNEDGKEDLMEKHEQPALKKTRVCVKAPCDDPSINDGCQWRKYGQKTAKTNPLPRAYYRCSMSSNCPVRKQVQRCGDDETSAYMTTYEGTHDHPLPMEASHVAAGTSAAVSLLQSGSSSSSSLSYFFPFHHFSVSTTNAHPTVTLDLTRPNYSDHLPNHSRSSSSLTFSSSSDRPSPSNSRTLSFTGSISQPPFSKYSQMAPLSHQSQTKLSGQQ